MSDPVRRWARDRPGTPAIWDGRREWTYREVDALVDLAAARLAGTGAWGRPVVLLTNPTPDALVTLHAILRAGGSVAPLHPRWTVSELRAAIASLQPALVVAEPGLAEKALAAAGAISPTVQMGEGPPTDGVPALVDLPPIGQPDRRAAADPCAVLWTSGSSGKPRGVMLGWNGFAVSARAVGERLGLRPSDTWLASLALAHVGGLALVLRAASLGSRVAAAGAVDATRLARLLDRGGITHVSLVPTMLHDLVAARPDLPAPPGLRTVLLGGAATPPALLAKALALGYPVSLTYGLTETTSQVATAPPGLVRSKPGTVGAPLRNVGVRIRDAGEIEVSGPTLFVGHVGGEAGPAPGHWYPTGDVGRVDADGHLWVSGRLDARILSGGVSVVPAEVERAVAAHPDVDEVVVIGTEDPRLGETVVAVVVPQAGRQPTPEMLDRFVRGRLGPAKVPRRYLIRDALPRTPNGKVDRTALERALRAPSG